MWGSRKMAVMNLFAVGWWRMVGRVENWEIESLAYIHCSPCADRQLVGTAVAQETVVTWDTEVDEWRSNGEGRHTRS